MKKLFKTNAIIACLLALLLVFSGCDANNANISDVSEQTTLSTTAQIIDTAESLAQSSETSAVTSDAESSAALTTDTESSTSVEESTIADTQAPASYYNPENLSTKPIDISSIPAYTDSPYTVVNGNLPFFTEDEITAVAFESYAPLDSLGRCGAAIACCGKETMPAANEKRGDISSVTPSGWVQAKYICVSGQSLYNRSHLIAWQLTAENANAKNLVSGTRYMNADGMIPFENMVADYIKETGNHVMYRATPIFEGSNLLASGVQLEAYSVEDMGEGICFNVYCYNVQPFIVINYATGSSYMDEEAFKESIPDPDEIGNYVLNKNTKKIHYPYCSSVTQMSEKNRVEYTGTLNDLKADGYATCGNCFAGQ